MSCTITDEYNYGKNEKRPEIPRKPFCRPTEIKNKMDTFLIGPLIFTGFITVLCYLFSGGKSHLHDTSLFMDIARTISHIGFILIILMMLIRYIKNKMIDKKLQNQSSNPLGYTYQGRKLDQDEPHFQLHLAYYQKFHTWELPDHIQCMHDIDNISSESIQIDSQSAEEHY